MNNAGRVFGMVTSANSSFYTFWALKSFFEHTPLNANDEVYLIDNDNAYEESVPARVTVIKNDNPLTFSQNANKLIRIADGKDKDLIFLSNDIILTPGWLEPLEGINDAVVLPSCNQTHNYNTGAFDLSPSIDWVDYGNRPAELLKIVNMHRQQVKGYFDFLLMPFYVFRLPVNVYRTVGYLDDLFVNGGEDLDYRIRTILAGFEVKYASQSYLLHFNGKSTWRNAEQQSEIDQRNRQYRERLVQKWGHDLMSFMVVGGDPNGVLSKHGLMDFDASKDFHNMLIKKIYTLTNS